MLRDSIDQLIPEFAKLFTAHVGPDPIPFSFFLIPCGHRYSSPASG
jgi:hypothetical protein